MTCVRVQVPPSPINYWLKSENFMLFLIKNCLNKLRIVNGYSLPNTSKGYKGLLYAAIMLGAIKDKKYA